MKFRLISKHGDGLPLMERLAVEGYSVDVWVKEPAKTGLPKALSWNTHLQKDTIILFDYHGAGKIADTLKKNGYRVYGAGILNDQIEGKLGRRLAEMSGLKIPRMRICKSFNEALRYFNEEGLAFRPQADGEEQFVLQEKVNGVPMSLEQFYEDGRPIPNTLNSRLESRGNVALRFWKKAAPKIFNLTLRRANPFLMRFQFSGPLSVKVVIDRESHKPYLCEWVAHFTSDGMAAFCEALNTKLGELLISRTNPKPSYQWHCSNGTSRIPDIKAQALIIDELMPTIKQLQKWRFL